jgi:glycerol-3-phosphate acyltransferase PlsX
MEGMGIMIISIMKDLFGKNTKTKIAALMVKDGIKDFRKLMDYNETGGAPLVGIAKPVIKAHGSSNAFTIRSAIQQAMMYVGSDTIKEIETNIDFMRIDSSTISSASERPTK